MDKFKIGKRFFSICALTLLFSIVLTSYSLIESYGATGPIVSASPAAGIYTSPQTITLTASQAATIYFTTDGSTPTTSSTSGQSPITGITISTNSTLKFFAKDSLGNIGSMNSVTYTIINSVVTQMNDTTSSFGLSTNTARQVQSEYVSPTSSLVGKSIDNILVKLQRAGSPTGPVQVGVFNTDLSVKQLFGTISASGIATTYTQYSFSLPLPQTYKIQSGDRIGIKFTGGNSSNYVAIMTDQTNTFDGTNSYLSYYTTSWQSKTGTDLYMVLKSYTSMPIIYVTPAGGTYTGAQLVTLTSSVPSTIYYTTDGSTPTSSSTSATSPASILINTNSTLEFFAKDSQGNSSTMMNSVYIIILPKVVNPSSNLDRFGIKEIHPTISGGVVWTSLFDNGIARTFTGIDPNDPWSDNNHGSATYIVDGKGKLNATGKQVRMFVHNPDSTTEWKENLEITFYHTRVSETQTLSYSGTQIFAHTNHGVGYAEDAILCPDRGYGAKPSNAGTWSFEKETAHHLTNGYADSSDLPNGSVQFFPNGMPKNTPIGVKYIIYQLPGNQMKVELWADLTNGANGGDWKKVVEATDTGNNWGIPVNGIPYDSCAIGINPAKVLTKSLTQPDSPTIPVDLSVYFRHEFGTMIYEKMSIREIDPSIIK